MTNENRVQTFQADSQQNVQEMDGLKNEIMKCNDTISQYKELNDDLLR